MHKDGEHILKGQEDSLFSKFINENDRDSFVKLYKLVDPMLYTMANRIICDKEVAEDITQQVWLSVLENKHNYNVQKGRFFSWIFTITKNYALKWKRKSQRLAESIYTDNTEIDTFQENDLLEISKIIRKLVSGIKNNNQQDAILMYYFAGLHIKQIAEVMETNEQNVKNWLNRGRDKIQSGLKKFYDSDSINDILHNLKIIFIFISGI